MSMSKKDYIKFAMVIKNYREIYTSESEKRLLGCLSLQLVKIFQADNSLFDRKRFLAACGYEE